MPVIIPGGKGRIDGLRSEIRAIHAFLDVEPARVIFEQRILQIPHASIQMVFESRWSVSHMFDKDVDFDVENVLQRP